MANKMNSVFNLIAKLIRFIKAYISVLKPSKMGIFIEIAEKTNFNHTFSISYSQGGEDLALLNIFKGIMNGAYIDIGAHHPSRFSITRLLYDQGWTGINIDANKDLIKEFDMHRPKDINICAAVGKKSFYEIYIFNEPAISTTNLKWKDKFISETNVVKRKDIVKGITLKELINSYFTDIQLDLLTIDIEGADLEALESGDFNNITKDNYPKWILLESRPPVKNALNEKSVLFAISLGYEVYLILPMTTILRLTKYKN
jgi:FkbM family methyltransferase